MSSREHTSACIQRTLINRARAVAIALAIVTTITLHLRLDAQGPSVPTATLVRTSTIRLPGAVDSNSPALWELVGGRSVLTVLTSFGGQPSRTSGTSLAGLGAPEPVTFIDHPGHGVWMESVVADDGGTWYGYYHNEVPATECARPDRTLPRIGAARSVDRGRTWENLGLVIEAPPGWHDCATTNRYFVGGVGDVGVMLDGESAYLYFFFSQYSRSPSAQGVAVARMPWASRDEPVGRVDVWVAGTWQPAARVNREEGEEGKEGEGAESQRYSWRYPAGTPLVAPARPWHDADPVTDAFWGASVHWNRSVEQYVMLLNRAKDEAFGQEGIYVSFAPTLDDPRRWSPPQRIFQGGQWYPQIIGVDPEPGARAEAGARSRFFMSGVSSFFLDVSDR